MLAIQYHIQDHVYLSLCAGKKNQIWGNLLTVNWVSENNYYIFLQSNFRNLLCHSSQWV